MTVAAANETMCALGWIFWRRNFPAFRSCLPVSVLVPWLACVSVVQMHE